MALLEIRDLEVSFGAHQALRGLSFDLERGERLGIVGESGAGKSMAAFAIINLISEPGKITAGSVRFDGQELTRLTPEAMRDLRGNRIAMIFQDPMMTLNPVLTIGDQMIETLQAHRSISTEAARAIALEKLRLVAVPSADARLKSYPHELSGGLRQRVVIAIALLNDPELMIADEPTTALDVTIQAEIMALLIRLAREEGMAMILITHDLAVVAESCERLAVMYAGGIIEKGPARAIIEAPAHPYTAGLIGALPQRNTGTRLAQIPGSMPGIDALPTGCAFHPRCKKMTGRCTVDIPLLSGETHRVACFSPFEHP